MKKLSIIIPAYNAEKTIASCIESIQNSCYENSEIIVIDDGSRDDTYRIANDIAAKDPRIAVVSKPNGGVSSARNMGMDMASGEYVMFADSDDTHEPDTCKKLVECIEKFDSDIAFCGYTECRSDFKKQVLCPAPQTLEGEAEIKERFAIPLAFSGTNGFMGSVCTCIIKKELIQRVGIAFDPRIKRCEDLLFLTEYLFNCKKMSVVAEALYNYRLEEGSATKKYVRDMQEQNDLFSQQSAALLERYGVTLDEEIQRARLVRGIFSLLVNEARAGNPKGLFAQIGFAYRTGKEHKRQIKALKPADKTLKIKRIIAKNGFLRVCFFITRRIQRAMGVYF